MLHQFVRTSFEQALQLAQQGLRNPQGAIDDERMIGALSRPNCQVRVELMLPWFNEYSLLMFRPLQVKRAVAQAALNCLDDLPVICESSDIINYASQLEAACVDKLPRKKNKKVRRESSLASKLLWCKYPHLIPIYDSHARRAIMALSKLMNDRHEENGTGYATFVRCWIVVYQDVEALIAQLNRHRYPYNVRLFDKLLWILGEETYGLGDPASPFAVAAE